MLVFHPPQAPFPSSYCLASPYLTFPFLPPHLSPLWTPDHFHPPASHLAWKSTPVPFTQSTDRLHLFNRVVAQSIFPCECVCVCCSHTLWFVFLPPLYPAVCFGDVFPLQWGSVSGAEGGRNRAGGCWGGSLSQ